MCLDLLVILAWLFRGNKKKSRGKEEGEEGRGREKVTGLSDCFKPSSSFSLWVKEGRMNVCSFVFTEEERT